MFFLSKTLFIKVSIGLDLSHRPCFANPCPTLLQMIKKIFRFSSSPSKIPAKNIKRACVITRFRTENIRAEHCFWPDFQINWRWLKGEALLLVDSLWTGWCTVPTKTGDLVEPPHLWVQAWRLYSDSENWDYVPVCQLNVPQNSNFGPSKEPKGAKIPPLYLLFHMCSTNLLSTLLFPALCCSGINP